MEHCTTQRMITFTNAIVWCVLYLLPFNSFLLYNLSKISLNCYDSTGFVYLISDSVVDLLTPVILDIGAYTCLRIPLYQGGTSHTEDPDTQKIQLVDWTLFPRRVSNDNTYSQPGTSKFSRDSTSYWESCEPEGSKKFLGIPAIHTIC